METSRLHSLALLGTYRQENMGTALSTFGLATSGQDYSQLAQLSHAGSASDVIASKVTQHYNEISKALNPTELMPLLLMEHLLDFNEKSLLLGDSISSYEKSCYILKSLEAKGPLAHSKFLSCVKAEKNHMGHEYIATLLEGKPFGSKLELEESSKLREAVQSHCPEMMDISLQPLVPLMQSKSLLTGDEVDKLRNPYKTELERVHLLLHLLDTKGPLAHRLFAECLRSESSHPTHNELYISLMSSCHSEQTATLRKQKCTVDDCALAVALPHKKFFQWKLQGPLKSKTYSEIVRVFHSFHHNGDWEKLETEATKYVNHPIPEYEVVAYLQKAISWVIRRNPQIVIQLVNEAKKIIKTKIYGENHSGLLCKSECTLARLYRYLKDYEKAREHVAKAKELLYGIEVGEDSARLHYCEACVTVECLNGQSTEQDFERVDELFARAIFDDRIHESGLGLIAPHSLLRLAQMCLSSTHFTPGTTTNYKKIERARNCLNAIIYSSLSQRSKCLYCLIESDLHRNCGRLDKAKESLDFALSISKEYNFELEISSAQTRLQSLRISQA